jgi:2-dehydro-3-deoxyphosphogluconate aldolase/(4S)-4-hydroxy-2-oxoglutarate aldolase
MSNTKHWKIAPLDVLNAGPVMPVIVIQKIEQAVPLAQALLGGGVKVLEVTLRSETEGSSFITLGKE